MTVTKSVAAGRAAPVRDRVLRPRHRLSILAVAVALVAVGGIGIASAANLTVTSAGLVVYSAARCSSATLSVHVDPTGWSLAGNKSAIQITNVPAECFTKPFQVAITDGAGTAIATGNATCSTATCSISTSSYDPTSAAHAYVLADTWGIPASWDSTCTVIWFLMDCT